MLRLYKNGLPPVGGLALFRTVVPVRSDAWGTAALGGDPSRGRLGYMRCPCGHTINGPACKLPLFGRAHPGPSVRNPLVLFAARSPRVLKASEFVEGLEEVVLDLLLGDR